MKLLFRLPLLIVTITKCNESRASAIKNFSKMVLQPWWEGLATIPGVSEFSSLSIGKPVIRGLECQSCFGFTHKGSWKPTVWWWARFRIQCFQGWNVELSRTTSLLYGSDAMSGVLYFNPKKFADASHWFQIKLHYTWNALLVVGKAKHQAVIGSFVRKSSFNTHFN
jgi:hypothetical protein